MLACEIPEPEFEPRSPVETFVQKSIGALAGRRTEVEVEREVQPLQVLGLETPEDDVVPRKGREGQALLAGGFAHSANRVLVVDGEIIQDMEGLGHPALDGFIPPRILVAERHVDPTVHRLLEPTKTLTALWPAKEFDELVAAEVN